MTTAKLFWWYNMYSSAEWSVTPRPVYCADGRKLPDIYTEPESLRGWLQGELGTFPLFNFWGPASSIRSSRWIADSARLVDERHQPTLTLVYLPHLDYDLQKHGPHGAEIDRAIEEIDAVAGDLVDHYLERDVRVIIVSEYGIVPATSDIPINRALREENLLRIRPEPGGELLDPGGSRAFAVADHQVAHVYLRDLADQFRVQELCARDRGR